MKSLGRISLTRNRKEYECVGCNEILEKDKIYPSLIGLNNDRYFTTRYHVGCLAIMVGEKIEIYEQQVPVKSPGRPVHSGKLEGLNDKDKHRYKMIKHYLAAYYRPELLESYQQKSTVKVVRTMMNMYNKYLEMITYTPNIEIHIMGKNEELKKLMLQYDGYWVDKFSYAGSNDEKLKLLLRTEEEGLPQWDN